MEPPKANEVQRLTKGMEGEMSRLNTHNELIPSWGDKQDTNPSPSSTTFFSGLGFEIRYAFSSNFPPKVSESQNHSSQTM